MAPSSRPRRPHRHRRRRRRRLAWFFVRPATSDVRNFYSIPPPIFFPLLLNPSAPDIVSDLLARTYLYTHVQYGFLFIAFRIRTQLCSGTIGATQRTHPK